MSPADATPIRLLLVDDHTILRQGMKQLLETDTRFVVSGEAGDGQEAIVQALSLRPDIILMDVNLPKTSGFEASQAILVAWPEARILVLTNQDAPDVVKQFMEIPIQGFLLKDVQLEDLTDALFRVMAGEKIPLAEALSEKVAMARQKASTQTQAYEALTDREREVLKALSRGYSNQQLADLLVVSPKTVHNHLYNIYSKIGVASRSEAIVWAMERGWNQ